MPEKSNWFSLLYHLPFVLMPNELIRLTGYSNFTVFISPSTMTSKLNCLNVNVPMPFSLFCSQKTQRNALQLDIFDFQGRRIVSKDEAPYLNDKWQAQDHQGHQRVHEP
ncbi:hypothetical protein MAM1_0004c00429 [Mucor ambiguus]|uniref:Uncharacterized protein n=1 Tax=Mucor ambiguus TaxID=91626 RepID=A0A0C9LPS2_9FUNG|nr:hypothetical protein MAM1_0004c00429 [Mucor ambiguus]